MSASVTEFSIHSAKVGDRHSYYEFSIHSAKVGDRHSYNGINSVVIITALEVCIYENISGILLASFLGFPLGNAREYV